MIGELRRDIQGLRAYAVLAVLLYHFGVAPFSGGFAGVDVFFVLSGFLMTQLIVGAETRGSFSLGSFYLSRARRILPALALLCITMLLFGWFWLGPTDYATLGTHTASTISFFSNFVFKDESGYFDQPSQSKWLLHSWSLSVEAQFYLLYPLIILALKRVTRQLLPWLAMLCALSLLACVLVSVSDANFAFYLLPTRAWELLLGGLVYLMQDRVRLPRVAVPLGLAVIGVSMLLSDPDGAWPGASALVPTLGTALVLLANRQDARLTNHPLLQHLGAWSYSIYLWHWPLVVGIAYFGATQDATTRTAAIALSLLLGYLSYRFVEQPGRNFLAAQSSRRAALIALGAVALIAGAGWAVHAKQGVPSRVSAEVIALDAAAKDRFPFPRGCGFSRRTLTLTPCIIGDGPIRWVVLGDSHASSIVGAVQKALPGGIAFYAHQCATIADSELRSKGKNNHCTIFMRQVEEQIKALPAPVRLIVLNRYSANTRGPTETKGRPWGLSYHSLSADEEHMDADQLYRKRLGESLCRLNAMHKLTAVQPLPEMGQDVPRALVAARMTGRTQGNVTLPLAEYHARHEVALAALKDARAACGITLLDPVPYLCDATQCYGAKDGQPRYFDDDHLSETGNRLLVPMFRTLKR